MLITTGFAGKRRPSGKRLTALVSTVSVLTFGGARFLPAPRRPSGSEKAAVRGQPASRSQSTAERAAYSGDSDAEHDASATFVIARLHRGDVSGKSTGRRWAGTLCGCGEKSPSSHAV